MKAVELMDGTGFDPVSRQTRLHWARTTKSFRAFCATPNTTSQGALHQSIRASSAGGEAENASEPGRAAFWPVIGQCFLAV